MTIKDIPINFNQQIQEEILTNIDIENPFMKKLLELKFLASFDNKKTICLVTQKAKAMGYKSILEEVFKKSYEDIVNEINRNIEKEELILLFQLAKKYNFSLKKEI